MKRFALGLACLAIAGACADAATTRPSLAEPSAITSTTAAPLTTPSGAPPNTTAPSSKEFFDAVCAGRARGVTTGTIPNDLNEISGLAASRRFTDVVWAHEDSGGPAVVTALGLDGSVRATVRLTNALNLDWEDIALGPGPGGYDYLYVADIGDNFKLRSQITIYRFPEPDLATISTPTEVRAEVITSRYSSGTTDAEALAVDADGTMWIVGKTIGAAAAIYRQAAGETQFTRLAATAPIDPSEGVSAIDLSADGRLLAVRTINTLTLIELTGGVASAPTGRRCAAPAPREAQGEAVALLFNQPGLVTVSEDNGSGPVELHVLRVT